MFLCINLPYMFHIFLERICLEIFYKIKNKIRFLKIPSERLEVIIITLSSSTSLSTNQTSKQIHNTSIIRPKVSINIGIQQLSLWVWGSTGTMFIIKIVKIWNRVELSFFTFVIEKFQLWNRYIRSSFIIIIFKIFLMYWYMFFSSELEPSHDRFIKCFHNKFIKSVINWRLFKPVSVLY